VEVTEYETIMAKAGKAFNPNIALPSAGAGVSPQLSGDAPDRGYWHT